MSFIGQPVKVLIPHRFVNHGKQMMDYFENPYIRAMGSGLDIYMRRKDGSDFPAEISLSPLHTIDGIIVSVDIRDITKRNLVEKELQDTLAALWRASSSAVIIFNPDRVIEYINVKFTEITRLYKGRSHRSEVQ